MKLAFTLSSLALATSFALSASEPLQFKNVFDFKYAKSTQLSEQGNLLAFSASPYRGNSEGQVYTLNNKALLATVERGTSPVINKNEKWVAFTVKPDLLASESASKDKKKKLKNDLSLVNSETGKVITFERVEDFVISNDGNWLAYRTEVKKKDEAESDKKADKTSKDKDDKDAKLKADKKDKVYTLNIVNLTNDKTHSIENVLTYAIAPSSTQLAVSQVSKEGDKNAISQIALPNFEMSSLFAEPGVAANKLVWHPVNDVLALSVGNYVNDDKRRREHSLYLWHSENNQLKQIETPIENWFIGKTANLKWSETGERLYFETRPMLSAKIEKKKYKAQNDLFDYDVIRDQKGLKVWHHKDAEIKPREIQQWNEKNKNRHYQAVFHLNSGKAVQLETEQVTDVRLHTEKQFLLGYSNKPHLHKIMYDGFFADYYAVDTKTGNSVKISENTRARPTLSPNGQFAAYFDKGQVQLKSLKNAKLNAITKGIRATFGDDQHDYPSEQPGYGFAGWSSDSNTLYVYDKYDIWAFDVNTQQGARLTHGYKSETRYRIKNLDKNKLSFDLNDTLLLSSFNLDNKQTGVAKLNLANNQLEQVLAGEARFDLVKKAKNADTLIYTRQSYHEFPDFWLSDTSLSTSTKLTNLNPQKENFAWASKPELIEYKGFDGEDLQGVLIKPAGYKKGDKVPVVIYFYRYMSQRMYDFPKMELNHRPNFPMFTSNGYAIFLPDIRFEIGHPGKSSTQTMINAAQKLIDMGVADKDKIGLQGHSWAGYQSAFMVTQTDMFKAVVSGAPVSNMTSAYSGIRLKSGLARQFQYETGQSRIGKDLFEGLDLYIENSPVFFADKVNTPIMIMFGDKDGAVPWQEGIQYYLALRRAGKDVIFLQYEGEPHHLKKFPNQVDFSIRMMEYFDHHLKDKPAPKWMQNGVPFEKE